MTTLLDFTKLKSSDPKVKYGFAKGLLKIGEENPEQLYTYLDDIVVLLKSENNVLKWTGIDLIGYLSAVDKGNKTDNQLIMLKKFLHGGYLITCNHAIFALGLIAQTRPQHKKKIIKELLVIEQDTFETDECKNIATGKVLEVFSQLLADIKADKDAIGFIQRATQNKRNSTKKRAIQLINKIQKNITK
jgi:hypothetical protein